MSAQSNKFYLTTPIYYVNARPHIGHAYSTIVADVLARRHRLLGAPDGDQNTFFLTGTDEHGQKIERSAAAAGIPPQQFADQVSATFRALWDRMGITYNDYIRTTEPRHKLGVQKLFRTLYNNGHIYLDSYTGSYCVSDEAFVDAPVGTPCPDCGRLLEEVTEENFFFRLSDFQKPLLDLIESNQLLITPDSARNEVLSFIRGNTLDAALKDAVILSGARSAQSKDPEGAKPATAAGAFSTLNLQHSAAGTPYTPGALKDLSISRSSFTWGIPVPDDIQKAAGTKQPHVIYVWLDALANYMTALGYGNEDTTLFDKFWPADLHLVGKEITRFHCVYWPAFLLALNPATKSTTPPSDLSSRPEAAGRSGETRISESPQLPWEAHKLWAEKWLPKQVTANGWLLFDNSKMSKSKGNVVRTETILDAFGTLCPPPPIPSEPVILSAAKDPEGAGPATTAGAFSTTEPTPHDRDLFAADVLRYYLLREIPFGQDGSFSFDSLITRYNADLANGYGNLVSRVLNMISLYCESEFPNVGADVLEFVTREQAIDRVSQAGILAMPVVEETYVKATIFLASAAFDSLLSSFDFNRFSEAVILAASATDAYLTAKAPWKLAKLQDGVSPKELRDILYTAAESIRIITALLYPILPYATARVWQQLGLGDIEQAAENGELRTLTWGGLKPGTKLGPLGPIFPRAPKELAQTMSDIEEKNSQLANSKLATQQDQASGSSLEGSKLSAQQDPSQDRTHPAAGPRTSTLPEPSGTLPVAGSTALTTGPAPDQPAPQPAPENEQPTTPQITIDDFAKIELRVAQITLAERIPKADKLLRLEVNLGTRPDGSTETLQILSGIAEFYTPEELIGRRIVVITNLAPRKMRGLESHGMLLAASDGDHGKPHLATCGDEIPLGSRLK